jgi:hypothetical protein
MPTQFPVHGNQHLSAADLLRDVKAAGGCSHPIRLRGEFINVATGEVNERGLLIACKDRRAILCPSCSYLYKADAWILISTGLIGGKGVTELISAHPRLFLTLTAPSFGPVHTRRRDGSCHPRQKPRCIHKQPLSCTRRHEESDLIVGVPLCFECFDYRGAILWNAESSRLWNRTIEQLRRRLALSQSLQPEEFPSHARLSYLKVAEFQRRGLVHFHVVLRGGGPGEPFSPPPAWLTSTLLTTVLTNVVTTFEITTPTGAMSWGRQFHISDVTAVNRDDVRIAAYLAKYATKTTDDSLGLARRFHSRAAIRALKNDHHRRLALTAWDLGPEPEFTSLNLRQHAHTFGSRGQLITKSRHYSTRFGDLREERAVFMVRPESEDPVAGTFSYEGRGYDDPRATQLAELLHQMEVELRHEARAKLGDSNAEGGAK